MLAVSCVGGQRGIVQILAAQKHPGHAGACIDQHAQPDRRAGDGGRRDLPRVFHAVDQREEETGGSEDHAGLEAAARAEIAVKLDVEREQDDERRQQLGDDAQDDMLDHAPAPSPASDPARFLPSRRRRVAPPPSRISTPTPAVKITTTSPSVSKPR